MYEYEKRPWYPNMRPEDVAIWERFIEAYPEAYKEVSYDVLVGSPPPFDTQVGDHPASDDIRLYKKKIDVVGYRPGTVDIIELKPNAGAAALGQVNGYRILYERDISANPRVSMKVITDRAGIDIPHLAEQMNVILVIV